MFNRLKSLARGATRRLASAPLGLLTPRLRAEALEICSNRMIANTVIPGGALKFFAPSPLLQDRAMNLLLKEPDMIRWIDDFEKDAVFWDIGANVGVFSIYAAVRRSATVLSFEPSAANYLALSRNIQLNGLNDKVTGYCIALSSATELGVLNLACPSMGTAMSQFGKRGEMSRYWEGGGEGTAHGMMGFAIDDFIARFKPPFPAYLKMDVDGLEWPILKGATKTLLDPRLRAAMVELSLTNRGEREQATNLLENAGFKYVSHGDSQGTTKEQAANYLFERPRR